MGALLKRVWATFARSSWLWPVLQAIRWCLPFLLLAILFRQLLSVGWVLIWDARPTVWIFLILLVSFCVQPVADRFVYRYLWKADFPRGLTVFFRKRFMNSVMLEYSGEAYFFAWATRCSTIPKSKLFHAIKDSNVLSAGAGLLLLSLVLLATALLVPMQFSTFPVRHDWLYAAIGMIPLGLCVVLVMARRHVTVLEPRQIATVFAIHLVRGLVTQVLQLALWIASGALGSIDACLTFVLLRLLISRLPIGANKEIIFVGAGLIAADTMHLMVQPVAALLVVMTSSQLIFDLLLVGLPWLVSRLVSASLRLPQPAHTGDAVP